MSASTRPTLTPSRPQRDREIGGEGRFADPALAAAHRDEGEPLALGGHRDADAGDAGAGEQAGAQLVLERFARFGLESGDVEHDRQRAVAVEEFEARGAAARQVGGDAGEGSGVGHVRGR